MVGFVAIGMSALALGVAASVALKVQQMRLQHWEDQHALDPRAPEPLPPKQRNFEQLRIVVAVDQDYTHPVFAHLLREVLFQEDAVDVRLITRDEAAAMRQDWPADIDLVIDGAIVCNGYAEVYYDAEFHCASPRGEVCTLIEKPPHGDRPMNLAIELSQRIARELQKSLVQGERRQALRELGDL